jgi:hypothetical protein
MARGALRGALHSLGGDADLLFRHPKSADSTGSDTGTSCNAVDKKSIKTFDATLARR